MCHDLAYWPWKDEPAKIHGVQRTTALCILPTRASGITSSCLRGNSQSVPSPPWWCRRGPTPSWPVSPASGWSGPSSSCSAASAASCSAGWSAATRSVWGSSVCEPWRWSRSAVTPRDTLLFLLLRLHRRLHSCPGSHHSSALLKPCRRLFLCRFLIPCRKRTGSACQVTWRDWFLFCVSGWWFSSENTKVFQRCV